MRIRENFADSPERGGKAPSSPPPVERVEADWKKYRVAWACPNYGPIFSQVYASHLSVMAYTARYLEVERLGDVPLIGATDRMYLHSAANECVRQSLAEPYITHVFWTESDMILPKDAIVRLLALDKDIAAGVYFLRGGTGQPCLYKKTPLEVKENPYLHTPITIYDERGPFKVDCPGMGCVLIKTDVFRRIEEPWFDLKANDYGKKNGYGQDLYFYTKVRWAGIEVWVDPGVVCDQIDTHVVGYADYRRRLAEGKDVGGGGFIGADAAIQDKSQSAA